MIRKNLLPWLGVFALSCAGGVFAADMKDAGSLIKRKTPEEVITAKLEQARPDVKVIAVRQSPIAGLYQVQTNGGSVLATADGDKIIIGEIFNVQQVGFSKWEDPGLMAERKKALATLNPKDSISFKAIGQTKAVVYVFTDVDCGFCRKLNSQMEAYNKLGIEVRYLAFPRAGIPSESADKLVTAWCSKDKAKALTMLKEDQPLPALTCDNPVAAQFELGKRLGVDATPAIWRPNGELKLGYLPPEQLAKELGIL